MLDYSTIENPYDNQLARNSDGSIPVAPENQQALGSPDSTSLNSGAGGAGGSVETAAVKSSGTLSDTWINTFLRSTNWQPKKAGFTIDGQTGYAEFANVFISGAITATSGTIGGFDIGSDYIRDAANSMGLASTSGAGQIRFWAGDTYANRATADFRVTEAGAVTGSSVTITGGSVATSTLNNAVQSFTSTLVFVIDSATQVSWGATKNIKLQDGTTYTIDAGNTGTMSALTYIYLAPATSVTVLQTSVTYTDAVGDGKILVATAQNGTTMASVIPYGGPRPIVTGDNISAGSILAGNIAASTITSNEITGTTLSAIRANLGSITAGSISVVNGLNTIGFTPTGTNAIFSGTTGSPEFKVTPAGILTATGASITGAISAATIDIGGADASSFHVDINGNLWSGAATYDIATNPFAVSNAGVLRAVSGTIGGWTLDSTSLSAVASGNTTTLSSGATAFASGPTGAPTTTITQTGLLRAVGLTSLNIKSYTCFETSTRFTNTGVAGGTTFGTSGLTLTTTAAATNYAMSTWFVSQDIFAGSPTFSTVINMVTLNAASGGGAAFFGLGEPGMNGSGSTLTSASYCGFWIQKATPVVNLYAIQNDGDAGAYTTSGVLTTLEDTDVLDLILKINGTGSVDYYWRKDVGTLSAATNLATRIPTATSNISQFSVTNVASAYIFSMVAISAAYER